jgi:hypothetical protein
MSAENNCPSCGAPNEIIFTKCAYCQTPLKRFDMKLISNEELIAKAAEWIGRYTSAQGFFSGFNSYKPQNSNITALTDNFKVPLMTLKGFGKMGETKANAQKYLTILAMRAAIDPSLVFIYQDLKMNFDEKVKSSARKKSSSLSLSLF